jgi:hypothetical protein
MKTLLRDTLTGLYYGSNQTWCAEVSEAIDFDTIPTAASVAQEQKLGTVNVVLRYEEPACELALPLALCIFKAPGVGTKGQDWHPRHPD